jgi:type IV pilus assembly protein PilM
MAKNCIGLDIGSSSVKVVQIKETSKGLQLVNFGFEPLPAQTIVDGAIMNQGAVVEAIRTLRDNLGIKGREVATAISGHSVIIKKIKVPPMTPEELEEQIPWEAEHHIPFSKDDVEIDHQLVGNDVGGGQMELLLVAAKKEVVADYSMVIREAKLVPMIMDVAAFTIQNAFEANYPVVPEEAIAIINVGATLSNINIIAGGTSAFTRDVTVGGNAYTEEIQKRLNVSQEEAEAWKIGSSGESVSEVVPQEVEAVIASVSDGVAGKFQRSLDFYLASSSDATITKIYLCGGSAKIASLQKALEAKSRTAVEVMDPFRKIAVDERRFDIAFVQHHSAEAAVAVGLSLRRQGDKQ